MKAVKILTGAAVLSLSVVAHAAPKARSAWLEEVRELVRDGKYKEALRKHWQHSAEGPTAGERVYRAELLERLGAFHLSLHERTVALSSRASVPQQLSKIGDLSLALMRFEPTGSLASKLRDRGERNAQWPASFRAALATQQLRLGQAGYAAGWLPDNGELQSIKSPQARARAFYTAGGVAASQNRLAEAAASFGAAIAAGDSLYAGLGRLQRARIRFEQEQWEGVFEDLIKIPKNTPPWYPGLMVGAWGAFRLGDFNLALGQLMSLHSPYLVNKFNPESHVLKAATLYRLCYYEAAQQSIKDMRSRYDGVAASLRRFRSQYGNGTGLVNAVLNFARNGGRRTDLSGYTKNHGALILDALLSSDPLQDIDRSLLQVRREEKMLDDLLPSGSGSRFAQALRAEYAEELAAARREQMRRGAQLLANRLDELIRQVENSYEQALAVEVEINTRLRDRLLTGKTGRMKDVDIDAEVKKGYEFWPFEGEYWRDELGGYAYATTAVCE